MKQTPRNRGQSDTMSRYNIWRDNGRKLDKNDEKPSYRVISHTVHSHNLKNKTDT